MAVKTLEDILIEVGAYVDLDDSVPTGDTLTTRVKFANLALEEWGNAYEWKQLRIPDTLTFAFSGTSFGLPTNFKKMMTPVVNEEEESENRYVQIDPDERFNRAEDEKYMYIIGDSVRGYSLNINPPLESGFSGVFDYQAFPSSMATLQDVCVCPHPDFIVKRVQGYVLEARSDVRFPQVKFDADRLLQNMIEEEAVIPGAQDNRIPDWTRRPHDKGFVIGED